jgi:hypothetical protein
LLGSAIVGTAGLAATVPAGMFLAFAALAANAVSARR